MPETFVTLFLQSVSFKVAHHWCRNLRRSFLTIAVILLLLHNFHLIQAQGNLRYYDINKIQSNEVIKGISKDRQGFVWLATDQGVLRFDGRETEMYFKELPSAYSKKFLMRSNGQFLILTDFGIREIVATADTTYFKPIKVDGSDFPDMLNYPKSIYEDKEGNIWVGESDNVVKINTGGYKRYLQGDAYRSINYHRSFSFTEDAFGQIWIAPYAGKLLKYNELADAVEDVNVDYPLTDVTGIITVNGDYLVIGGKEGILKLKVDSDENILRNEFMGGPRFVSTVFLINNTIYAGTWDNGLYRSTFGVEPQTFSLVENIPFNDILDFHFDAEKREIWITGSENLGLLKPSAITPITRPGKYRAESADVDSLGNIYFSSGSEIFVRNSGSENADLLFSSQSTYFDRILLDNDKMWIGDAFGSIFYYELQSGKAVQQVDTGPSTITHIFKDHNKNIWFSGRLEALVKISDSLRIKHYDEVKNSMVLKADANGVLFCGATGIDSLLYIYNAQEDHFEVLDLSFDFRPSAELRVEDMAFDSIGNILLATNEGLLQVKTVNGNYQAKRVLLKGIDANEPVKAIAVIENDIWLAYSHALAVVHHDQVLFYTRENGLPSRVLEERGFLVEENRLFVATAMGLAAIDVETVQFVTTPPPIIKSLLINGVREKKASSGDITLKYGSRIEADFVSLSYPGTNILYQTRIVGLDDAWSEPSPNSSISVLGFSEGRYRLLVRARDAGSLWSEPLELQFVVAYPWFKTWWALLLFLGAALSLIFLSVRVYNFHLIRQKVKLQKMVEIGTREINLQKNEIIEQKNRLIQQKEELIEKNNAVFKSQQALSEADLNYLHLKEKQLQDQIEYRNKQITTHTLNIIQKNEMLKELREKLEAIVKATEGGPHNELKKLLKIIDESFRLDKDWEEFKLYFEQIYTGFYAKLKINYPELTNQELRHCALIRLNLSNNECASILGISPNSIKVSRTRLRKKLNLENHHSLTDFVMGI